MYAFLQSLTNVPSSISRKARSNSARVFITMGPAHATGSFSGFAESSRKRTPELPAVNASFSARSKSSARLLSQTVPSTAKEPCTI